MQDNQIQEFLTNLDKTHRRLTAEEMEMLYELAFYPDPRIRGDVAALLLDHYEEKSEAVLLRLTYDADPGVRTDAVDSLCIGRREEVLQRLLYLAANDPMYTVRGYAVHSIYDVFVNMLGNSDNTHKMVINVLSPLYREEKDAWVQTCYYCVLYLSGDRTCLQNLLDCLDDDDFHVRNSVLETFGDILDDNNEEAIEDALQYYLPFENDPNLSAKMEELLLRIEEFKEENLW